MECFGAEGAAGYMGKYMQKMFPWIDRRVELLGMERRWSTNQGWPGNGALELKQTSEGGWGSKVFRPGHVDAGELGGPVDLLERKGENIVKLQYEKSKVKTFVNKMRSRLHD